MRTSTIAVRETVNQLKDWMEKGGYAKSRVQHLSSTTNQLLKFMESKEISEYNTKVGIAFMCEHYGLDLDEAPQKCNQARLRDLAMLSEFQLHGIYVPRNRERHYAIPALFRQATEEFLAYRRFEGIVEKNMGTISLYLERFFKYLTAQGAMSPPQVTMDHVHGFLRFLTGFSNASKDHMMRTVRQFMGFCFKNGHCPTDLSGQIPLVRYEKRAKLPSAYSYDEVMRLLSTVDRSGPTGKRNYAILLLVARLGLRSGDVCRLKFENLDWENNRISLTQHKTGRPLTLPLLEDVGLAIIDYLKFGRPKFDSQHIFLKHSVPNGKFQTSGLYSMVARYVGQAGLLSFKRKVGPHALRHSLASRLLEERVPLPVISEILGHASTNTTAAYLAIDLEQLRSCALEV